MEKYRPTRGDILASIDVLKDVSDISDSLTPEECVEFRQAVEKVMTAAREAVKDLNQQLVLTLEGDLVRDGVRYYIGYKSERKVFDHTLIGKHVRELAILDKVSGELLTSRETAERAVEIMSNLYLAPSTSAKVTELDRYGIPRKEVLDIVRGEKEVKVIPAGGAVDS